MQVAWILALCVILHSWKVAISENRSKSDQDGETLTKMDVGNDRAVYNGGNSSIEAYNQNGKPFKRHEVKNEKKWPSNAAPQSFLGRNNLTLQSLGLGTHWVQYGVPRTATTVQYKFLVLFGKLLCGNHKVVFMYIPDNESLATSSFAFKRDSGVCLSIVKTHFPHIVLEAAHRKDVTYFRTSSDKKQGSKEELKSLVNVPWTYTQNVEDLMSDGIDAQIEVYMEIFGMNDKRVGSLVRQYMELWDHTRICCGAQMSLSWRVVLVNRSVHSFDDIIENSHPCQQHNLTDIEKRLFHVEDELFKGEVGLRVPGYCNCTINKTIRDRLKFNDPGYTACRSFTALS